MNTKINRGPETYPTKINIRYEMNVANTFEKSCENPNFQEIFGHQRAKNGGMNTKINRGSGIGILNYAYISYVSRFVSICKTNKIYSPETLNTLHRFKLELMPGNAQIGAKSSHFLACVTLKFDR